MNRKQIKVIRRKAKTILVEWLQSLLPESEKDKVNEKNIFAMMPKQTHYYFRNQIRLSAWSYKWVIKKLKRNPDLTFTELNDIIMKNNGNKNIL